MKPYKNPPVALLIAIATFFMLCINIGLAREKIQTHIDEIMAYENLYAPSCSEHHKIA